MLDDEEPLAQMLGECLRGEGYEVVLCHDALKAERTALEERPDLIVIDYNMPGKTGVQVLADLRAREETRALPALFLSGTEILRFAGQVPPESRVRFLIKPVDLDAFVTMVREMLDPNGWSSRL